MKKTIQGIKSVFNIRYAIVNDFKLKYLVNSSNNLIDIGSHEDISTCTVTAISNAQLIF